MTPSDQRSGESSAVRALVPWRKETRRTGRFVDKRADKVRRSDTLDPIGRPILQHLADGTPKGLARAWLRLGRCWLPGPTRA
jgi:hypothetical protein